MTLPSPAAMGDPQPPQPYGCVSPGTPLASPSTVPWVFTLCPMTGCCVGVPWQHPEVELFLQGPLSVVVTYGGDPIPKSPFPVTVAPPLQLGKVKVQGLNSSEWQHWGNGGGTPREGSTLHVV